MRSARLAAEAAASFARRTRSERGREREREREALSLSDHTLLNTTQTQSVRLSSDGESEERDDLLKIVEHV